MTTFSSPALSAEALAALCEETAAAHRLDYSETLRLVAQRTGHTWAEIEDAWCSVLAEPPQD